jgi:Sulfotransferase domain
MRQNGRMTQLWQTSGIRTTRHLASPRLWYRQFTAHRRGLPQFIIAGAQKAGTTSLFAYLAEHPQCAASLTKEVHYFDQSYEQGESWYRMHFPVVDSGPETRACFESSPYYMFDPRVPARVHELLPNVRLIFLLRNPVSRAYSHYQHSVRRGREILSFSEALAAEPVRLAGQRERLLANPTTQSDSHRHYSYAARGLYAEQLADWLRYFSRDQILVVHAERMFKQPRDVFADVLDFLELESWTPSEFGSQNTGRYTEPMPEAVREQLKRQFAEPNERLFDLLGVRYDWR